MGNASDRRRWGISWKSAGMVLFLAPVIATPVQGREPEPPSLVVVRTYNYVPAPRDTLQSARREVDRLLGQAGVLVKWVDCYLDPADRVNDAVECTRVLRANEVIMRITAAKDTVHGGRTSLGYSVIEPNDERPVFSTIYFNRVQSLAEIARVDTSVVLGRVIAHELGHLLLRSSEHTPSGLMRAFWSQAELQGRRPDDWRFTRGERVHLRAALAARLTPERLIASR
jgi:hypothetical protein